MFDVFDLTACVTYTLDMHMFVIRILFHIAPTPCRIMWALSRARLFTLQKEGEINTDLSIQKTGPEKELNYVDLDLAPASEVVAVKPVRKSRMMEVSNTEYASVTFGSPK